MAGLSTSVPIGDPRRVRLYADVSLIFGIIPSTRVRMSRYTLGDGFSRTATSYWFDFRCKPMRQKAPSIVDRSPNTISNSPPRFPSSKYQTLKVLLKLATTSLIGRAKIRDAIGSPCCRPVGVFTKTPTS